MVTKIQSSEYLRRYDNMDADERKAYCERVGEWMRGSGKLLAARAQEFNARMQNVLTISVTWNDAESQAFDEGARLLSALTGLTDTWLPDMLYIKSAKRAIGIMHAAFETVITSTEFPKKGHTDHTDHTDKAVGDSLLPLSRGSQRGSEQGNISADDQTTPNPSYSGGEAAKSETYEVKVGGAASVSPDAKTTTVTSPVPTRPRHIDQYVHLLPQKTQEHAAKYGELMRELDESRRKLDLLMDDKTASAADREAWAKKVTKLDNAIGAIKRELDAGWEQLVKQGRVVVDELGMAHVVPEHKADQTTPNPSYSGGEAAAELSSEDKARRRELRKWLVDTRRGNGDTRNEHVKKWQENFKAFLAFDGDAAYNDEKIKAAAEHYGIDLTQISQIPQNSQNLSETNSQIANSQIANS